MKKELLILSILFLVMAMPFVSCLNAQDLAQIEQIIADSNNKIERNIIQKIQEKENTGEVINIEFKNALREERIKTIIGNAVAIFLALILYSLIRLKLRIKEKEVLDYAKR